MKHERYKQPKCLSGSRVIWDDSRKANSQLSSTYRIEASEKLRLCRTSLLQWCHRQIHWRSAHARCLGRLAASDRNSATPMTAGETRV